MNRYKIFLVEDEENLNQILKAYLQKENWEVQTFLTGEMAEKAIEEQPHLWILDIMLPDIDGFELLSKIKAKYPSVPIIFISARDESLDRILGLELGGDDYIAKPFLPKELVIRCKKILDRVYEAKKQMADNTLKPLHIDTGKRKVYVEGMEINLTSLEFDLLYFLSEHQDQAISRDQIIQAVWGNDYYGSERVVDDLIRSIRKKLPQMNLETIYGFGYRMVP
ncbi:MAG: response regulator transcription factor [Heyndrickxia sp.]